MPTSFGTGGRRYSTDSRTGSQRRGRLSRPRQLTTPWPTRCPRRLTKVTADSPVHTGLPRRGRFTRERLQLHLAIISFMADYFRPATSGDIHLKYILLVHIIFVKEQFIFALVCNIVCRTVIHYQRGLYHGCEARAGNVLPGVRPFHITR